MTGRIAVIHSSGEGHTADIADHVAAQLRASGHDVDPFGVAAPPPSFTGFDGVVVAGSIHAGSHDRALQRFVCTHRDELSGIPTAFISVSISAASDDPVAQEQARHYVEDFIAHTGWQPTVVLYAGGMLAYTRYGFIKRQLVKQVAKTQHLETDTSRDWDHTDWPELDRFIADFAQRLASNSPAQSSNVTV